MNTSIAQEQRDTVRQYYSKAIVDLNQSIKSEIDKIGGEDMLLQRVDLMEWVYFSQEDLKIFKEVLRMLDGVKDVDGNLISAAIKEKRVQYQHAQAEIERLKKEISKYELKLEETKKQLETDKEVMDVLTSVFAAQ